jgi:uroporphyrinogen-III synthase
LEIKRILVSQPQPENGKSPYLDLAIKYGLVIDFKPFIAVEGVSVKEFRRSKISLLDFTAVIFTSKTAIDHYFRLSEELKLIIPNTMKYFCLTESIAFYLQKYIVYRKRKIFSSTGEFDDLLEVLHKHSNEKYLLPVSDVHKLDIPKKLEKFKFNFTKAILYNTVSSDMKAYKMHDYNILVFFTPAGIQSLLENFPDFQQKEIKIGAFGPLTAKAIKKAGLKLDIKAPTDDAPSMTMALELFIKENLKKANTK